MFEGERDEGEEELRVYYGKNNFYALLKYDMKYSDEADMVEALEVKGYELFYIDHSRQEMVFKKKKVGV